MIQLIRNFDTSLIKFKNSRKTANGSIIIDIEEMPFLQTPWCKIAYPVEHTINVEADGYFLEKIQEIDNIIVDHCSKVFDLCPQDITEMYKSLVKNYKTDEKYVFRISMNTSTIVFDKDKEYNKTNSGEVLKINNHIRFIFKLKKITMSNHEIKIQTDLIQVETNESR